MTNFNTSVFISCILAEGFKEIPGPNDTCRRFSLHSAEGLELAQLDLDHRNTSTFCTMQQEYDWNIKTAKMLEPGDDFFPAYQRWLKFNIQRCIKAHHIGFSVTRHICDLYRDTVYRAEKTHEFNMPVVEICVPDGEGLFALQKYSVCVDEDRIIVTAHIAGRASRYDSLIENDLEFEKFTEWLTTEHKTGLGHLQPAIERTVDGKVYHLYRTQNAARKLPLYRDAKSVKIIRETLVASFVGDDVFNLIGEVDYGKTTYEFIAYEIGVVI